MLNANNQRLNDNFMKCVENGVWHMDESQYGNNYYY